MMSNESQDFGSVPFQEINLEINSNCGEEKARGGGTQCFDIQVAYRMTSLTQRHCAMSGAGCEAVQNCG